jgi:hypothetical protein
MYTPKEKALADELAERLHDWNSISLYLMFTKRYTEAHLRDVLERVMSIPDEKIKRTRGALFTYLIKQHESHNR